MSRPAPIVTATLGLLAFSWALVASADYRHEQRPAVYETVVREVAAVSEWEAALEVPTPIADSLVDWVELERQTDCLWEYLEQSGVEITLEIVLAAGTWTDALGGACYVIGADSE